MNTKEFIYQYRQYNVSQLALQKNKFPEVDMAYALDQIEGWQRARTKLPEWVSLEGIIFPPHISMEQCSSESTAKYKCTLIGCDCEELIDLTGGFGVDFSYMARNTKRAIYIEQQSHLCEIAHQNFALMGLRHVEVLNEDGVNYLCQLLKNSAESANRVIYLDPARRDTHGAKVYGIEDCTPDVLRILPELLSTSKKIIVKLSPMLDLHATVKSIRDASHMADINVVDQVHIVSVDNECKELLLVLSVENRQPTKVFCVNNSDIFDFTYDSAEDSFQFANIEESLYLYEPNASIMKAGCFVQLSMKYNIKAIGRNSHLFLSSSELKAFPGRKFRIISTSSMNKKELKDSLKGIDKANISVRNFPLSVAELRKRLKLKDGGDVYIFATTIGDSDHRLLICSKI